MSCKHLSLEKKHYIEISMKSGKTLSKIGKELNRLQKKLLAIKDYEVIAIIKRMVWQMSVMKQSQKPIN